MPGETNVSAELPENHKMIKLGTLYMLSFKCKIQAIMIQWQWLHVHKYQFYNMLNFFGIHKFK